MTDLTIAGLTEKILELAREKGFGATVNEINVSEKIALLHSEVSEAYAAYRAKNMTGKDGFNEELADVVIRTLHLAGALDINMEAEIRKKMEFNKGRDWDWGNKNETHT